MTLDILARTDVYDEIGELGTALEEQLRDRLEPTGETGF